MTGSIEAAVHGPAPVASPRSMTLTMLNLTDSEGAALDRAAEEYIASDRTIAAIGAYRVGLKPARRNPEHFANVLDFLEAYVRTRRQTLAKKGTW